MPGGIVPDMTGIAGLLREGTPELREALAGIARKVMNDAIADPLPHRRDRYRQSFGVDVGELEGRLVATVFNTDYTAVWVELGAHPHRTPMLGYHVMFRALERNLSRA